MNLSTTTDHPPQVTPPPYMTPYPLAMQLGMKRFYGHLFLAPNRLYFVCTKTGGAWAAAIGQGLGGALGGALVAMAQPKPGDAPAIVDEAMVMQAVSAHEGSLILEATEISMIKQTIFWRLFKWKGKTIGLPQGMSKQLRAALGPWAKYHNVPTKGF